MQHGLHGVQPQIFGALWSCSHTAAVGTPLLFPSLSHHTSATLQAEKLSAPTAVCG